MPLRTLYAKTKSYHFLMLLLASIVAGAFTGYLGGPNVIRLKPLGDIFLNLLFSIVVPLVFFSVSSAIASLNQHHRFKKIVFATLGSFLFTSVIAGIFMLIVVKLFPPTTHNILLPFLPVFIAHNINVSNEMVNMITVPHFGQLFSVENMLALMVFSTLIGFATSSAGKKGEVFAHFLQSGMEVCLKAVSIIMYYAPIGFFAYFAVLVSHLGPQIVEIYFRTTVIYYLAGIIYFIFGFSFYAYLSHRKKGINIFWKNIFIPSATSLATCSSAASMPSALDAARKMKIPNEISEFVIPFGTILHKDGSTLGGVLKIAFLFSIFHMSFSSPLTLLLALIVSILVGTVMGAIPSGGMIGEMLILAIYGFPTQSLLMVAAISVIIDPLATMINVVSNIVCSLLVTRWIDYF